MSQVFLGEIVSLKANPHQNSEALEHIEKGALVVDNGYIIWRGVANNLPQEFSDSQVIDHGDCILAPGFIDCHVHFPQLEMTASYGTQLLEWLETYTFPTESKFDDFDYAKNISNQFLDELIANGTTSALVFGTVHFASADAFFEASKERNLRMIAGKVMMDRNAPDYLIQDAKSCYQDCRKLIEKWHGVERLSYAVTPRFAPTSSSEQLQLCKKLLDEYQGLYLHTHLSENLKEIDWVKQLFPESSGYTDVYEHYGLCTEQSIFAHCIYLDDDELHTLKKHDCGCAFCPSSNLFIGSGLFPYQRFLDRDIKVGLGSDIGGGNHMSLLKNNENAYKIMQLQQNNLDAAQMLYLATLGAARTLSLDEKIGSLDIGKEADFIVLDPNATQETKRRSRSCTNIQDSLFTLFMLGDDRHIKETYILGKPQKNEEQ